MALFGGGEHRITIITEAVDKASGKMRKISETVKQVNSQMGTQIETTRKMNTETNRLNLATRRSTRGMHQFAFEFLGVMFLGMAITRMFRGLIRTSMEWAGVTEIMSTALGILFLPIALEVQGWALDFLDTISDLNDEQKEFIGWVTLGGIGLGTFLFVLGTAVLGLNSLRLALGVTSITAWILGIKLTGAAAKVATAKVAGLKIALATLARVVVGVIIIAWSIKSLKGAIEEGSVLKELGFILGGGLGLAFIGLQVGGPWGAAIGFALGIIGMLTIDWVMGGKLSKLPGVLPHFFPKLNIPGLISPSPSEIFPQLKSTPLSEADRVGGGAGGVNLNNTFNVNVSDKVEFERMLNEFNITLTEDVRRLIKT